MSGSKFKTDGGASPVERGDDFLQARGFDLKRFTEHFCGKINHQDTKARRKTLCLSLVSRNNLIVNSG
jgi:hypothetical protein